jgi:hypothetical protein
VRDLTDLEQRLVRQAETGDVLDMAPGRDITHEEMADWGEDRHIRADVLRDLLLGRLTDQLDPRGVRARGIGVEPVAELGAWSVRARRGLGSGGRGRPYPPPNRGRGARAGTGAG